MDNYKLIGSGINPLPMPDNEWLLNNHPQSESDVQAPSLNLSQDSKGLIGKLFNNSSWGQSLRGSTGMATNQPSYGTPTSDHLGEHVGDGYFKLNNNYWNQ